MATHTTTTNSLGEVTHTMRKVLSNGKSIAEFALRNGTDKVDIIMTFYPTRRGERPTTTFAETCTKEVARAHWTTLIERGFGA